MDSITRMQDLTEVVPWGRTFDEYVRIFELRPEDLRKRILDCGGGPASFTAEATQRGLAVVACDPVYRFSAEDIERRVHEVYPIMLAGMRDERERFDWRYAGSPEAVAERRLVAAGRFLEDLPPGLQAGRYIAAGLPSLPFADRLFDLVLSSHFLFLYSDQLSLEFHVAGIREMLRVGSEVRAYPLLALDGRYSPHVEPVMEELHRAGYETELVDIDFKFQKGATQLLRVRHSE